MGVKIFGMPEDFFAASVPAMFVALPCTVDARVRLLDLISDQRCYADKKVIRAFALVKKDGLSAKTVTVFTISLAVNRRLR